MDNKKAVYNNYNKKGKLLGIIDYKSAIILVIYIFAVITIIRILPISLEIGIYLFAFLVIPFVTIVCVHINNESAIGVLFTILDFSKKRRIYVDTKYRKNMEKIVYVKNYRIKK